MAAQQTALFMVYNFFVLYLPMTLHLVIEVLFSIRKVAGIITSRATASQIQFYLPVLSPPMKSKKNEH